MLFSPALDRNGRAVPFLLTLSADVDTCRSSLRNPSTLYTAAPPTARTQSAPKQTNVAAKSNGITPPALVREAPEITCAGDPRFTGEGSVEMYFLVDVYGHVKNPRVTSDTTGDIYLENGALYATSRAEYRPAMRNSEPIEYGLTRTVVFDCRFQNAPPTYTHSAAPPPSQKPACRPMSDNERLQLQGMLMGASKESDPVAAMSQASIDAWQYQRNWNQNCKAELPERNNTNADPAPIDPLLWPFLLMPRLDQNGNPVR